jgi:selenide, water dikinase
MQKLFKPADFPDLLVGLEGPDDAAVWRLDESRALVITTDFFTPVVDAAYDYGAIAAANSLSDVYAMGGKPFLALNIAAIPDNLPVEITSEILRGGAEKAREAGVVIAGGHTVKDKEPKYGLVVVGFVDPDRMLTKAGLRVGDALVITKPLGFGATTTALKRELAGEEDVTEVVRWMSRLNSTASQLAVEFDLRGGTDITGYSLVGHGMEMADASGVSLQIEYDKLPLVSCARKYAEMGTFPGGAFDNRAFYGANVRLLNNLEEPDEMLIYDPQTSGGLLLGVPEDKLPGLIKRAQESEQPLWVIGKVVPGKGITVK